MQSLNDLLYGHYRASYQSILENGRAFSATFNIVALGNGLTAHIGLITNNNPLIVFSWFVSSDLKDFTFEIFRDGTFSGGTPVTPARKNYLQDIDPALTPILDTLAENVTIDTPGTLEESLSTRENQVRLGPLESSLEITARNATSYMAITNNGGGASDVQMVVQFGVYT